MNKQKLYYSGQLGGAYGWGVCGENLTRELSAHYQIAGPEDADIVFMPLVDYDFNPNGNERARLNVAYTFFEAELGHKAAANAARYDVLFAGSTWCLERMREAGIANGKLLIQGVDNSIFYLRPPRKGSHLKVFSGGKFEWRKGQDLVIAAFREFLKVHPTAELICSWSNRWPQFVNSMVKSPFLEFDGVAGANQQQLFESLLLRNGIPFENFSVLEELSQPELTSVMWDTDFGVFPNRCEGGTNLVLMEYLSCGRRAVANLKTGHADLVGADIHEIECGTSPENFAEQSVESVLASMLACAKARDRQTNHRWHWSDSAQVVVDAINSL